jgi:nitronate monooxygenase
MTDAKSFFDIDLPIIQAPMAGVQLGALAIEVSNAGGLGAVPCALLNAESLRKELGAVKAKTSKPYNVNFFCHVPPVPSAGREAAWRKRLDPFYKELGIDADKIPAGPGRAPFDAAMADVLAEFKPPVVSFHFGLPAPELMKRVKALGSKILSSATTVEEARWLEAHGVDAVIAQGVEAGGHRGLFLSDDLTTQLGTFALLPQVVAAVKIPVIAAGGVADARGVAAVLSMGAIAAQIGTSYLLCPEATTSAVHRAALKSKAVEHTVLTNVFTGRPARGMVNRVIREVGAMSPDAPEFPLATSAITPLRQKAEAAGSGAFSPLWSGQNASGCREIGAAELTRSLAGKP